MTHRYAKFTSQLKQNSAAGLQLQLTNSLRRNYTVPPNVQLGKTWAFLRSKKDTCRTQEGGPVATGY